MINPKIVTLPYNKHSLTRLNTVVSDYTPLAGGKSSTVQVLRPRGHCNIIEHIPCDNDYGITAVERIAAKHEHMDVSGLLLKTANVRLSTSYGITVNLNNTQISRSLAFSEAQSLHNYNLCVK